MAVVTVSFLLFFGLAVLFLMLVMFYMGLSLYVTKQKKVLSYSIICIIFFIFKILYLIDRLKF